MSLAVGIQERRSAPVPLTHTRDCLMAVALVGARWGAKVGVFWSPPLLPEGKDVYLDHNPIHRHLSDKGGGALHLPIMGAPLTPWQKISGTSPPWVVQGHLSATQIHSQENSRKNLINDLFLPWWNG